MRDAPPCYCAPAPPGQIVLDSPPLSHVQPTRSGSCATKCLQCPMRFLPASHFENWRQGRHDTLQRWIQVGPAKLQQTIDYFRDWVKARSLRPIEAEYTRCGPRGLERLTATPTK